MKHAFESSLKDYIAGLIRQKRKDGFSYVSDEYHLKRLDEFLIAFFPDATTITRDIASKWALIRETEGWSYRNRRVNVLCQLSKYILSMGNDAYVPRNIGKVPRPVLYIPSRKEISAFISKIDSLKCHNNINGRMTNEYKILFRLYYCCGMRLSEARLLKKDDMNIDNGVLVVYKSKGHKDRLVYIPHDGKQMLVDYIAFINSVAPNSPWLFPGRDANAPLTASAIQQRFTSYWETLPFANNADKRPSVHCLRHAFVVDRLNDWMQQGLDTQELLSYLSKYLGHSSPSETFYYYHLVDNAFSVVKEKDTVSNRVIPEVLDYEEI